MSELTVTTPASVTVLPPAKTSALNVMAARYSVEPAKLLDTLKQTVFKNATDAQLMALVVVANEYGLNPFTKQIYAFPDKSGGIVPVIGVDGWYKMMNENPKFDGIEVTVAEDTTTGKPFSCTAVIHVKDRKFPTSVTEHLSECARNTDPWNKQPRRMLRHRAIIQAIRVAFGFSAMDPDEAEAVSISMKANISKPSFAPPPPLLGATEPATDDGDLGPQESPEPKAATRPTVEPKPVATKTAKLTTREEIEVGKVPFDDFRDFLVTHNVASRDSVDSWGSYEDVPESIFAFFTVKLLRSLIATFGVTVVK